MRLRRERNQSFGAGQCIDILLGRRTLLSTAIVTPATGPRPYNMEVMAILNFYFGGSRRPESLNPPVLGN